MNSIFADWVFSQANDKYWPNKLKKSLFGPETGKITCDISWISRKFVPEQQNSVCGMLRLQTCKYFDFWP